MMRPQMYGSKPKPGMKPGMKPGGTMPRMMADGDMGSPADMDAPTPDPQEDDEQGEQASLEQICHKLDKIMEALGLTDDDGAGDGGMPPDGMNPGGPNTRGGNPEMQA